MLVLESGGVLVVQVGRWDNEGEGEGRGEHCEEEGGEMYSMMWKGTFCCVGKMKV